jgi:predicted RNase H-like HicB family nuclease
MINGMNIKADSLITDPWSQEVVFCVQYSWNDDCWIATVPKMPGCSARGRTLAEAENKIRDEIDAWAKAQDAER